ncbi:unnamed protein product [Ceutorhynchus assimilis]|uniref:Alanine--tRNA ligase n=1 Tax=Ceutorhynchus assimilis TaxID=467358 RepID=A0A9N9QP69_9CUCU|nr:unnamed protein product [Ceutorhynchus assimilis]
MDPYPYLRLLSTGRSLNCNLLTRKISKYIHKDISSKAIRRVFLDFFVKDHEHTFVRSSPVVPFCDPTVPFVNAGMNQFKSIFLGTQSPHFTRVSNSQKCIRVGGKHNDLNIVGQDGYHHTFFEMLGNWSFGDYFKEDACKMAWKLLTQVYKIPPSRLYVTYFGGDEKMRLKSDMETFDIWRTIGVKENRILPFTAKDNFWEMGITGPCGPCTEIHFDHLGTVSRSNFVNKNLHDLTEIWNLVFIQYNRLPDGSIISLPKKHVDTGLGLERLCCALQGKSSTYDTDLFDYLINAIEKNCSSIPKYAGKFGENDWNNVDTSYRVLADHLRMLTVCLADGIIPEQNQKLRRIIRKCFLLSETVFGKEKGLVKELSNYVVENLGDTYPEMEKNAYQVHQILDYEEEIYNSIRLAAKKDWQKLASSEKNLPNIDHLDITPSFIKAFRELNALKPLEIDGDLAHRLYDTHGFDSEGIEQLAQVLNIKFSPSTFTEKMEEIKLKSKSGRQISMNPIVNDLANNLEKTDDFEKYAYNTNYEFSEIEAKVLQIIEKDNLVNKIKNGTSCSLLLDKTNLYCEAGGQEADRGKIKFQNSVFNIELVKNINGLIFHKGFFKGDSLEVGSTGTVSIDRDFRLGNMRNHTSAHLLNAAIKQIKTATCQKSSKVTHQYVNLDVSVFGPKLNFEDIVKVEEIISKVINDKLEVRVSTTDSQGLYSFDQITLIPGEVYPENEIRVIEIADGSEFVSREPCCGTHVHNTADLEDFCVVSLKSLGRSTTSLHGVSGDRAKLARKNAEELAEDIEVFKKSVAEHLDTPDMLEMGILSLKKRLNFDINESSILPYVYKTQTLKELNNIGKQIKDKGNDDLKNFICMEMQDALKSNIEKTNSNTKYLVHYLRSSMMLESVPLHAATAMCSEMPVIIIAYSDDMVKARCCVPKDLQSDDFNAENWLKETVAPIFKSRTTPQKLQDGVFVSNMKPQKVHVQDWHHLLAESIESAKKYINEKI